MPKDYNTSPYYDDFDEAKNFVRMLFNPERAVQARELTQLQTMLSNQNARFANHFFEDGTKILEAKIELDQNIYTLTLDGYSNGAVNATDFLGKYIKGIITASGLDTGAQAYVSKVDTNKLYLQLRGGEFLANGLQTIEVADINNEGDAPIRATFSAVGKAVFASLSDGIVYISGNFVRSGSQTIIVDPDLAVDALLQHDIQIGYELVEDEVTFDADSTLLDPASGAYNYNAPGADRYRSYVGLASYTVATIPADGSFYGKMFIQKEVDATEYEIQKEEENTTYSDILDLLAKRTYETNGDYTTNPFIGSFEDHPTDDTKFNFLLDAGVAYVKGYRHETKVETTIEVDKARDFLTNVESVWVDQSPYIKLKREDMMWFPTIANMEEVNFYATDASNSPWTADLIIGTARVTGLVFTGTEYRLYLTDHQSILGDVASVKAVESKTGNFVASTVLEGADDFNPAHTVLYSTSASRVNAYPLQQSNIKSNDNTSFIHRVQKYVLAVPSGNQIVVGTLASEEIDLIQTPILTDNVTGAILIPDVNYTTASTPTDLTFNFVSQTNAVGIHYYVEVTGGARKSKVITTYTETVTVGADFIATLSQEDIIAIKEITRDPNSLNTGPQTLVAEDYVLDDGTADFYYGYGSVSGLPSADDYEIVYEYYLHGGSGNYFDINSYTDNGIIPEEIPTYYSENSGDYVFLADHIDFRRKLSDIASGVAIPTPRTYMFVDYEYYLQRLDIVEIDKDGNFNLVKGVSSLEPSVPEVGGQSMHLYTLRVPAYTYEIGSVTATFVENKNYTMRDIGELEQRIDNLEYYSSLTLLESSAEQLEITDEFGNNRFKNGILVDNFSGGNVADVNDSEWFCAFDPEQGQMRPVFKVTDLDLMRDESASKHDNLNPVDTVISNSPVEIDVARVHSYSDPINNVRFHESSVTLEYTPVPWVTQMQASGYMNVNPYSVFAWDGNLKLNPDTDYWMDTVWLPDLVTNVDGIYDDLVAKQIADYGTKWGSWKTNWTGTSTSSRQVTQIDRSRPHRTGQVRKNIVRTTTRTRSQSRQGTKLVATPNRILEHHATRVIDVSVIPYMRSIPVVFDAKNLKPNTDLHVFFNEVNVNDYITPDGGMEPSDPAYGCRTDGSGKVRGTYLIPSNDTLKFRTGQRPFLLTDDTFQSTTSAEAEFLAAGHLQKKQRDMYSISKPIVSVVNVNQNRRTTSRSQSNRTGSWYDPVAETFLVNQEGGIFATDIEVFFKTKDPELPVSIMIVETENGYPSQRQLPFAQVTLDVDDVQLSDDGTIGTTFTFSDPVYLSNRTEYAFIVYSNSDNYNIWFGEIGAFDVEKLPAEERIVKQPYAGVFFKSQNGSTWTADQTKDLKFNIKRAKFVTKTDDLKTGDIWMINNFDLYDGDLNNVHADFYATNAQFEIDNITFDETELKYAYKFADESLFTETNNSEDLAFTEQKHLTNGIEASVPVKNVVVNSYLSTENNWVSPVVSVIRSHVILINNIIFDWAVPALPYENTWKAPLTDPTPDILGHFDAGAYVSRNTTLQNPSDDLKVIMDVKKDGASDVEMYFSTGKFSPKYIEIYDTNIVDARTDLKGQKLYLYDRASADDQLTNLTEMACTGVDTDVTPNRIFITGIGDPSLFRYFDAWTGAVSSHFITTENIASTTVVADWGIGTPYTIGDYSFFNDYMWKALEDSTGVEPTDYGTAWEQISYNEVCENGVADEEIKTDTERKWRPMVIESQNNDEGASLTSFVEYTWIPKDSVEEEFSTFQIKVQLKAKSPAYIPTCASLRAIATY